MVGRGRARAGVPHLTGGESSRCCDVWSASREIDLRAYFGHLPDDLTHDPGVVPAAADAGHTPRTIACHVLGRWWCGCACAAEVLKTDGDVVLAAATSSGHDQNVASEDLNNDQLQFTPEDFKTDGDVVLTAATSSGHDQNFASEDLNFGQLQFTPEDSKTDGACQCRHGSLRRWCWLRSVGE